MSRTIVVDVAEWAGRLTTMTHVTPELVREHLAGFRSYLSVTKGRQPGTVERYVQAVAAFLEFLQDGTDLTSTRRASVISFLEAFALMGVGSPSSHKFNGALAAVRAFFVYLNRIDVMETNPTNGIDRHQVRPPSRLPLTLDEYLALEDAASVSGRGQSLRNVALLAVLFYGALRVSEVSALDREQVDLVNCRLLNVRVKGGDVMTCQIPDACRAALEAYLEERDLIPAETNALFLSIQQTRMSVRAIENLIPELATKAGIRRRIWPHLVRHSTITNLERLGVNINAARAVARHKKISTTQLYSHADEDLARHAVETLGVAVANRRRELGNPMT